MGKKAFHRNSDKIQDDVKGVRVIDGRLQCVTASEFQEPGQVVFVSVPKVQDGIASKGQVRVINGAVQMVQG